MTDDPPLPPVDDGRVPPRQSFRPPGWSLVLLVYLALGVFAWWHAWSAGPSVSLSVGSVDPQQDVWFFAWALHAIEKGENPFLTYAIYAPQGVNLLANPSILGLGLLFAPVTALFGPLVAFNVAATLAPAVSAFSAFFAFRRYASWQPAAFIGGLCYGFGPFIMTEGRYGHLHLTFLAIPPLVFVALDEMFVRRRRSPLAVGALLAVLLIAQFFVSSEVLALTVIVAVVGLAVLAATHARQIAAAVRFAAPGLFVAALVTAAALAYPVWFALAGPRHFTGPVFPNLDNLTSTLAASVVPHGERPGIGFVSGGNGAYLGAPLLILLVGAPFTWRRDPPLRFAVLMAAIAYLGSLGASLHVTTSDQRVPLPAAVFQHLPVLDSLITYRFAVFVDLFAGLTLAVVLDRVHAGELGALGGLGRRLDASQPRSRRAALAAACGVTAAAAVAPLLLLAPWPYSVHEVAEPPVFREAPLTTLPANSIIRDYPPVIATAADPMLWQAIGGIAYELSDGYANVPAPRGHATEKPQVDALSLVFAAGVLGTLEVPATASTDLAIRAAVGSGHVAAVVVSPGATGSAKVAAVLTSALGQPALRSDGAMVWVVRGRY